MFSYDLIKRTCDFSIAFIAFIVTSPILLIIFFLVWIEDKKFPLFLANRVGKKGKFFKMYKIRTMIFNASKYKVNSTSSNDRRITNIGKKLRNYKIDEIPQFINIIKGEMSFVGPRPNTFEAGVELYTNEELILVSIRPGITDLASIVFSDEAEIISKNSSFNETPDDTYNRLIRPWKSKLGIWYVENKSFLLDLIIIFITIGSIFERKKCLNILSKILPYFNAPKSIVEFTKREKPIELY